MYNNEWKRCITARRWSKGDNYFLDRSSLRFSTTSPVLHQSDEITAKLEPNLERTVFIFLYLYPWSFFDNICTGIQKTRWLKLSILLTPRFYKCVRLWRPVRARTHTLTKIREREKIEIKKRKKKRRIFYPVRRQSSKEENNFKRFLLQLPKRAKILIFSDFGWLFLL